MTCRSFYIAATLILTLLCFSGNGCSKQEDDSFQFSGEWAIESYTLYSEVDGNVVNDQTFNDAGTFRFNTGGSGFATLEIPGISLPQNQPVTWSFNDENSELSVNYETGQDSFIYDVTIHSENRVTLIHNVSHNSGMSSAFTRTTIELSRIG